MRHDPKMRSMCHSDMQPPTLYGCRIERQLLCKGASKWLPRMSNVVLQAARALIEKERKMNAREEARLNATTATSAASNLPSAGGTHVAVSTSAPGPALLSLQGIIDGHLVSEMNGLCSFPAKYTVQFGVVSLCVCISSSIHLCSRSADGSYCRVWLWSQAVALDNFDSGAETEAGSAVTVFSESWSGGYDSG